MGFCYEGGLRWNDSFGQPAERDRRLPGLLLPYGGTGVVWVPVAGYLVERLLGDPQVHDGSGARLALGAPSQCHTNVAERIIEHPGETIHTGWALSDDGLWRNHSWTVTEDGTVVETTVERIRYVGAALDAVETLIFASNEWAGEQLVASDPTRWLPVVAQLLTVAGDVPGDEDSAWQIAAALRGVV